MSRTVQPSVEETAFCCPHCSAYTTQYWFRLYGRQYGDSRPLPFIMRESDKADTSCNKQLPKEKKEARQALIQRLLPGFVVIEHGSDTEYGNRVFNLNLSACFNCKKVAVAHCLWTGEHTRPLACSGRRHRRPHLCIFPTSCCGRGAVGEGADCDTRGRVCSPKGK